MGTDGPVEETREEILMDHCERSKSWTYLFCMNRAFHLGVTLGKIRALHALAIVTQVLRRMKTANGSPLPARSPDVQLKSSQHGPT